MKGTTIRTKKQSKQVISNETTFINFHMHKTAGSTRDRIFERQFPKEASFFFSGGSTENVREYMNSLKSLSEKERQRIRYVWGGPFFGLHKHLPGPCTYVTFIRDPVERVASEYNFVLRVQDHGAHNEVISQNISLEDYVRKGVWLAWNGQARYLRGVPEGSPCFGQAGPVLLSDKDLETAKKNLREHFLVGVTDRFDESLILVKRAFGWSLKDILYVSQKVDHTRPFRETIGTETVKLIEGYNKLDIKLYEFARQLLEERISQQDSSFKRELRIFQLCNNSYGLSRHVGGISLRFIIRIFKAVTTKR